MKKKPTDLTLVSALGGKPVPNRSQVGYPATVSLPDIAYLEENKVIFTGSIGSYGGFMVSNDIDAYKNKFLARTFIPQQKPRKTKATEPFED